MVPSGKDQWVSVMLCMYALERKSGFSNRENLDLGLHAAMLIAKRILVTVFDFVPYLRISLMLKIYK